MSKVIDKEFSAALEYLTDSRIREIVSSKSVARVPEWTPEATFVRRNPLQNQARPRGPSFVEGRMSHLTAIENRDTSHADIKGHLHESSYSFFALETTIEVDSRKRLFNFVARSNAPTNGEFREGAAEDFVDPVPFDLAIGRYVLRAMAKSW